MSHWEPTGTATSGGVALLRPQTYVSNPCPSLVVSFTPASPIPSSLGKHPPPLSFYCIPDIHFLKRPHLQLLAMRPHLQLLAIPGSKDEIQTKTRTREIWAGFLRSHCTQQRWSQERLESDVNVSYSTWIHTVKAGLWAGSRVWSSHLSMGIWCYLTWSWSPAWIYLPLQKEGLCNVLHLPNPCGCPGPPSMALNVQV